MTTFDEHSPCRRRRAFTGADSRGAARGRPTLPQRYLTEAAQAIASAAARFPQLTRFGWESESGEPLKASCVATSLAYLDAGPVVRLSPNGGRNWTSSYLLKHRAEDWGRVLELEPYIANGDLICAALWRRVPYRREPTASPNCRLALRVLRSEIGACEEPHARRIARLLRSNRALL